MRILQLGKAYPPVNLGGVEVTIQLITEGLHQRGIYCDVLGVNDKFLSKREILKFGTIYRESLIIKAFSTLFSFKIIYRLFLLRSSYDIIHVHHPDPMSALALWIVRPNCKLVVHWHSDILKQKYLLKIYRPIQNWLLNRCNSIICTSNPYAENSEDLKYFSNKISIIPIGIDKSKLIVDQLKINKINQKFKNKKIVLAIGRMSYYKGYEYLVEASKYFNKDIKLIIIGEGELKNNIQEKVDKDNLSENIIFLGKVSDVIKNSYLQACDIFVLSSIFKTEAFGIVQLESMAFGKPIVSTMIPNSGVDWVNQNLISGLTVPIKDSKSIANAINLITQNPDLYIKLSIGAKNRFDSCFTQNIMSNKIINLYTEILQ